MNAIPDSWAHRICNEAGLQVTLEHIPPKGLTSPFLYQAVPGAPSPIDVRFLVARDREDRIIHSQGMRLDFIDGGLHRHMAELFDPHWRRYGGIDRLPQDLANVTGHCVYRGSFSLAPQWRDRDLVMALAELGGDLTPGIWPEAKTSWAVFERPSMRYGLPGMAGYSSLEPVGLIWEGWLDPHDSVATSMLCRRAT
ncbi:MAG: hypothetical protein RLW87_20845 [Alphaproteobacteria bacterium]